MKAEELTAGREVRYRVGKGYGRAAVVELCDGGATVALKDATSGRQFRRKIGSVKPADDAGQK